MAMNPMQRKANNYLLIGIFGTLLVTGAIIAFLFIQLNNLQQEKKKQETAVKKVYVLNTNIKSGEEISTEKVVQKEISSTVVSADTSITFFDESEKARIAKIDLLAGTIITDEMFTSTDQVTTNDLRNQEYNMVVLPSTMESGDYVDIRLRLSNGVDFVVASKKQVDIPQIEGIDSATTMKVKMNEAETQAMANAIVEAYIDEGSILYATTYVEPGLQTSTIPTYVPSAEVQAAMNANPNIEQNAKTALITRYNSNVNIRQNLIESDLYQYLQDKVDNIESKVQEEITRAKEARASYLESLGGY
ncbi:MAG: SAF domain-containing protein [Clostridia bacterium]|nr:SAF domain-containing protein [Clostridia bacterium]